MKENMDKRNWSIHVEFAVLMTTLFGGYFLIDSRMEARVDKMEERLAVQGERIDKLYEMYCSTLKEIQVSREENMKQYFEIKNK